MPLRPRSPLAAAALLLALACPAGAQERSLRLYGPPDLVAEETLAAFAAETGAKVVYEPYSSDLALEAALLAGESAYDLVLVRSGFFGRQVRAGLYAPLDRDKLPNLANLDPVLLEGMQAIDPGNAHGAVHLWGTVGIGLNLAAVRARMPDAPLDSLDLILNPALAASFADCGIGLLDSPGEVLPIVLAYLGHDPHSEAAEDLAAAEAALLRVRPLVRQLAAEELAHELARGALCLALAPSWLVRQAAQAATAPEIVFRLPREGTLIWFLLLAIPADAPSPARSHTLLDFLLRPESAAAAAALTGEATANVSAMPLIAAEARSDPALYPPPELRERLFGNRVPPPVLDRLLTAAWQRISAGG